MTNGRRLHVVSPGDNAWARRFRDILGEIIGDLGGPTIMSEAQRQLARRAATISIACERLEGDAAAGTAIDLDCYGMLVDRLGRCLQRLGVRRIAREIDPGLDTYLASPKERTAGGTLEPAPDVVNGDATPKEPHVEREVVTVQPVEPETTSLRSEVLTTPKEPRFESRLSGQPETAPAEAEPEGAS